MNSQIPSDENEWASKDKTIIRSMPTNATEFFNNLNSSQQDQILMIIAADPDLIDRLYHIMVKNAAIPPPDGPIEFFHFFPLVADY